MHKTVLVTGASRGIGRAIALYYGQRGYNVAINCRKNYDLLEEVKEEIKSYGVNCLAYVGDVSNYDFVKDLYKDLIKSFGSLNVLINNAGISYVGLFSDMTFNEWQNIIDVNLTSVFNCTSIIVPNMIKQQKGKIINISSIWGNVGASMEVAYSTTKGGINALTKALAKELAPSNIQVNAIACGAIDTEMNNFLDSNEKQILIDEIPSNRLGSPIEVASLAYYLGNKNDYLTGQILTLDGGWS